MKRFIVLLLTVLMAATAFSACGESTDTSTEQSDVSAAVSEEISQEVSEEETMTADEYFQTVTKLDSYKAMTVKKFSANTYRFVYKYEDGGQLSLSLILKSWGTWNIGDWTYVEASGKRHAFDSGSTDWENVYVFGKTAGSVTWRGGNHGNDRLVDLTFYDATTGEAVDLSDGKEHEVAGLRIIEHTQLYDSGTNNVINSDDDVLVNMERIYTINGPDIYLECNVDFVKDTYSQIGYSCMFPIAKKYGDFIKFTNVDGTEKVAQTPTVGKSQYASNFSDFNRAKKVNIWGSQYPQFQFEVEIYDDVMLQSSKHLTRYWDMNTSQNKLYFSIFSNDTVVKIAQGTHWDTLARWSFNIDNDFTFTGEADQKIGF